MVDSAPLTLTDLANISVDTLKGLGPKKREALAAMGIDSVLDLLMHYPRRFVDRTRQARLVDLLPGEEAMVLARVASVGSRRVKGGKVMVTVDADDGSARMRVSFFNQAWRERQLAAGTEAVFFGKLEEFRGQRQMTNPVVDLVGNRTGRILPVYPQSERSGITTWELAEWVAQVLRRTAPRGISDPLPPAVRERLGLVERGAALRWIHEPETMSQTVDARRRLVLDELLRVQLALVMRKVQLEREEVGIVHAVGPDAGESPGLVTRFLEELPYELTAAQRRVIGEVDADLARPAPMHRLLQGDVGSGKTLVAVAALLTAVQGGYQGAFMAPTEVLAEQQAALVERWVAGLPRRGGSTLFDEVRVELLANRVSAAQRRKVIAGLANGDIDLVVGTHALIQEAVEFASLGVVVIDEQHRFGVEQRAALRVAGSDGRVPDVLVMTATPIPRTAAMTVYGDLDVSVLDELPPGRTPIATRWVKGPEGEAEVWASVRAALGEGHQAYVVCPLIEESEKLEATSATATYDDLVLGELAGVRVGLLHGRLPSEEKASVMDRFRQGELDVLVATTVIEVGVDVPNASVMVILDADRFGIAQLHQLRGRVGRGAAASRCWLVSAEEVTPDGESRLEAMVRSTDGFELAEVDLDLRGEGTIMGERQKGRNELRLASLRRDREWVERARGVAFELVDGGSGPTRFPELFDELRLFLGDDETEFLLKG